jgi:hypothetical protein
MRLNQLYDRITALLLEKRAGYGTANLNTTGELGIAVRLIDKAHRLYNVEMMNATGDTVPVSDEDTLLDIAGYALIALYRKEHGLW